MTNQEEYELDELNKLLIKACRKCNTGVVKELLEKGADVHMVDSTGIQPLHEACSHGNTDIVQLLLENGADMNVESIRMVAHLYMLHFENIIQRS